MGSDKVEYIPRGKKASRALERCFLPDNQSKDQKKRKKVKSSLKERLCLMKVRPLLPYSRQGTF